MFTGIVQGVGVVHRSQVIGLDLKLTVDPGGLYRHGVAVGDSVAVDGVCLTVSSVSDGQLCFVVSRESLSRTLLGAKVAGDPVNLELALLPDTRLGGHFVTGHVDGIGHLDELQRVGASDRMRFSMPPGLSRFVAEKGSICIDGVSLTVNAVAGNAFEVNIVPHTAQVTTMKDYRAGTRVHLEIDIIARYLDRLMSVDRGGEPASTDTTEQAQPAPEVGEAGEITQDFLTGRGFAPPDIGGSED